MQLLDQDVRVWQDNEHAEINQPSITWTRSETNRPDGDILEFHGKPLPIKRFKDAIHDMIRKAKDIL